MRSLFLYLAVFPYGIGIVQKIVPKGDMTYELRRILRVQAKMEKEERILKKSRKELFYR